MIGRWTPLSYVFILTSLIPEYNTIRIINYDSKSSRNTDELIVEHFASESCQGEESVILNNFNLIKVPANAIKSRVIKNINLEYNLLDRIPTELFDNVPLLECLNVAHNKIPYHEMFNFSHSKLKTLILDYQLDIDQFNILRLDKVYYSKAYFPQLEMLHVNGISPFMLDFFPKNIFPRLTTLRLTENKFRNIDMDLFFKLPASIEHLHLERNVIHTFKVHSLGNLISLYLDDNPIQYIAVSSNHSRLQVLSLRNCDLYKNPDYFMNIALNDLSILELSRNRLDYLPEYFFDNAKYLQDLQLSNNSFTEIPNISKLRSLKKLSLSYNHIEFVTNLISNTLTILNLQSNKISRITDSNFENVPLLQDLDLSYNKLNHLTPGWANGLKNLKHLNLRFNMFMRIANIPLRDLVNLESLYIKSNLFHEIDEHEIQLIPQTCTTYVT